MPQPLAAPAAPLPEASMEMNKWCEHAPSFAACVVADRPPEACGMTHTCQPQVEGSKRGGLRWYTGHVWSACFCGGVMLQQTSTQAVRTAAHAQELTCAMWIAARRTCSQPVSHPQPPGEKGDPSLTHEGHSPSSLHSPFVAHLTLQRGKHLVSF